MRAWLYLAAIVIGASLFISGNPVAAVAADSEAEMRVMSFNIRFGTANDGANRWDQRQEFLVDTIKAFDPDLLGTQETLALQRDYLAAQLPDYAVVGVGRDDGGEAGEMAAVYYRKARFEKLAEGHFWLSLTPNQAGSKSWDSALPRLVTWVRLRDRRRDGAPPLLFLNTHFDHRGPEARRQSALLLRQQAQQLGRDCALILSGDFNAPEGSPPYQALFRVSESGSPFLLDAYRQAHPQKGQDEGTFSAFQADRIDGPRIDWIAVSPHWEVAESTIDRTSRAGRTPSDHRAVTATLRWKSSPTLKSQTESK